MLLQTDVLLLEALQPHLQNTNTSTSRLTGDWHGSRPALTCSCSSLGDHIFLFMTGSIRLVMSSLADRNISLSTQTVCSCCLNLIGQSLAWRLGINVCNVKILSSSGSQVYDGCQFKGPGNYSCQSLSHEDVLQRIAPLSLSYLHGEGNESSLCWPSQQSVIPDD